MNKVKFCQNCLNPLIDSKVVFLLLPILAVITVFSLPIQDVHAESRHDCRSQIMSDRSLTHVERYYELKTCNGGSKGLSSFEQYYTEELHDECPRILKENSKLNHISRLNDMQECNRLQTYDSSYKSEKLTKFSRTTIEICDEKYDVYLLVGAKGMRNQAGDLSYQCLKLYSAPMWNSTDTDRKSQLHKFINDQIKQTSEQNKELRQKFVEQAKLNAPAMFTLKHLFEIQKEKIHQMENHLKEAGQTVDYSKQDFFDSKYEYCLEILYDDAIFRTDKVRALDECAVDIDSHQFNDKVIMDYSKKIVNVCEKSYQMYLDFSKEEFYKAMKKKPVNECVSLYKNPIWKYQQDDRTQVLENFVYKNTISTNHEYLERKNSVKEAHLNAEVVHLLSDLYLYEKEKLLFLDSIMQNEKLP